MFPPGGKALQAVRALEHTNKSNYDWTPDLVKRAWIEIAYKLQDTCAAYDMELDILLDGKGYLSTIQANHWRTNPWNYC